MVTLPVILEVGKRRSFASAARWPGWSRAGKTPELALEQLAAYHGRYAVVASRAGHRVPVPAEVVVIETLEGDATTDFGAPGAISELDRSPHSTELIDLGLALLEATWSSFDKTAAAVTGPLAKGPRGGGREVDAIVEHVAGAEQAYASKIGIRRVSPGLELRNSIAAAIRSSSVEGSWPLVYFLRRTVWHVLDHLWEIEDRSNLTPRSAP